MSLHSLEEFLKEHYPFNKLTSLELKLCLKNIDISYYPKDTVLITPDKISDYFFIIIKGDVGQYKGEDLRTTYHENDSFDANSLIYNTTKCTFKVDVDLICYELNKKTFLSMLESNKAFKEHYLQNMTQRLQAQKKDEYASDLSGFMVARVHEIYLDKVCIVDAKSKLVDAINESMELKTSTIIVKDGTNYGIITDSILKKDVLLKNKSLDINVEDIAKFPMVCIEKSDFLFKALLLLTQHTIKRIGVMENGVLIGILNQIDILSYFANHTYIVARKIQYATNIEELKIASLSIHKTVKSLFIKSVKTVYIAQMVAQLNEKIYQKLYELIIPTELQNKCAFLIMGSEGRDEQILKTDQDNALIINDDCDVALFDKYAVEINNALLDFGFPKCDGDIMVTNPFWRKSKKDYLEQMDKWLNKSDMNDYMNLAIFFDAKCVAGDKSMLDDIVNYLFERIDNKDVFMAYFAKVTLNFDTPIGIFSKIVVDNDKVNIKKGAIFAIVHGVRCLSLEYKLEEHSTTERIKKLHSLEVFTKEMSTELIEAFGLLQRLKLEAQIENTNSAIDNNINVKNLGKIQRDMLKDSFQIVNKFKKFITHHYRLNSIS